MFEKVKKFYFSSLSSCNENCLFCVKRENKDPEITLNTEECKKEIKKGYEENYQELQFDGGEPTLREDLPELISFAEDLGFRKICILTNALKFSDKKFATKIVSAFRKTQPSFSVSLHSHKKEISEYLVDTPNTFEKTIKGIKNLLNLGAYISIYHIIARQNYKDTPGFIEFLSNRFPAIKCVIFSFIYPAGAALKNKHIFPKLSEVEPYFLKALDLCKKKDIFFSISSCGMVPLCFFKNYEQYFIAQQIIDQPENIKLIDGKVKKQYQLATKEFHSKSKIKPEKCNICLLNNYCAGLWKIYAQIYGTEELKPVKDKQRLRKIREFIKENVE